MDLQPAFSQHGSLDETLAAAAKGDGVAWTAVVKAYAGRVFGLLVKQCGDRELAEEITQATFVKIVTHIDRYDEQGRFESWLFRIAMNQLRDEMRRRKRQAKPMDMSGGRGDDDGGAGAGGGGGGAWQSAQEHILDHRGVENRSSDPMDQAIHEEQVVQLRKAVAQLPEADQEILHLRHTAGLTFAQIAETLEQPLGTVLARGHRALNKLKKAMLEAEAEAET